MVAAGRQRGRPVEVPDHLVIGRRSSFEPRALLLLPGQGVLGFQHTDAWVDAGRRSLQTGLPTGPGRVKMVGVKHCSVWRRSDRLAVQLHLLLGVSELQRAGSLVRWRLLTVGQANGRRQVDDALRQVGVRRLEAARGIRVLEALRLKIGVRLRLRLLRLPLQVGRWSASVGRAWVVHLVIVYTAICPHSFRRPQTSLVGQRLVPPARGGVSGEQGACGEAVVIQQAGDDHHHHHHHHHNHQDLDKLQLGDFHALEGGEALAVTSTGDIGGGGV